MTGVILNSGFTDAWLAAIISVIASMKWDCVTCFCSVILSSIGENCGCSAGHAKDVGYELLKILSDIFGEPVDKSNLKSVLERQGNVNISLGNRSINSNVIGCINIGSKQRNSKLKQRNQNKTQIEKISKLRYFGLNDGQIAEVLELPLEVIKQVVSE